MTFVDILAVAGLVLLLGCFLALGQGRLRELPNRLQKFKGFGIELEISIVSVLFIISAALCVPSPLTRFIQPQRELVEARRKFTEQINSAREQVTSLTAQLKVLNEELIHSKQVTVALRLDMQSETPFDTRDLMCNYGRTDVPQRALEAPVMSGKQENQVEVTLDQLTRDAGLVYLHIVDRRTKQKWSLDLHEPFYPLYPVQVLTKTK